MMTISADQIKQHFDLVSEKMSDLPVFNSALEVATVGFDDSAKFNPEGCVIGVLITPWCMNLVLLPKATDKQAERQNGEKSIVKFPSGTYEFIYAWDERLGGYLSCSLFSPMTEFTDQESALTTGGAVIEALFNDENENLSDLQRAQKEEKNNAQRQTKEQSRVRKKEMSRRGFLTAGLSRGREL